MAIVGALWFTVNNKKRLTYYLNGYIIKHIIQGVGCVMYCTKCGAQIKEEAIVCVNCGCAISRNVATQQTTPEQPKKKDEVSVGLGFLAFFFPMIGLTLWLVWKDDFPKKAKPIGICALVSAILFVVGYVFIALSYYILFFSIAIA